MKKSERNLLVLLGIVVVIAAIYYISNMSPEQEYDELGLSRDSGERISELSLGTRGMPKLSIDDLQEEKASFTGAQRNLFIYDEIDSGEVADVSDDEDEDEDDTDVYEVPVADDDDEDVEPVRSSPTLAGYEFIGLHEDEKHGPTAVFSWRGRTLVGRTGQVVNDAFEIKEITRRYVLIHVMEGDFEQRLQLTSPAGATSGGMK